MRTVTTTAGVLLGLFLTPLPAIAQSFEIVGTRAQGMAGAFVGMADDASAVYWNPAGLAGGAYFSLVLDGGSSRAVPDSNDIAASGRSGWLLALTTPALGLSYYRLQSTIVRPPPVAPANLFQVDALVSQHVGATLVQSLSDGLAVGTTLKL